MTLVIETEGRLHWARGRAAESYPRTGRAGCTSVATVQSNRYAVPYSSCLFSSSASIYTVSIHPGANSPTSVRIWHHYQTIDLGIRLARGPSLHRWQRPGRVPDTYVHRAHVRHDHY